MDNYIAEIRMFPYNRIPTAEGWMPCNGQTLPIQQYAALYALIGVYYGGDGRTNFMLPNLNGRTVIGAGLSPISGTTYQIGRAGGSETVKLTTAQIPAHNHSVYMKNSYDTSLPGTNFIGNPNVPTSSSQTKKNLYNSNLFNNNAPNTCLNPQSVSANGGSQAHENRMPFVTMIYCIATQGVFPPRQ